MFKIECSEKVEIPISLVWNRLINFDSWSEWNDNLEFCEINEPISKDSIGLIKAKGDIIRPIIIKEIKPNKKLSSFTKLFSIDCIFSQEIKKLRGRSKKIEIIKTIEIRNLYGLIIAVLNFYRIKSYLKKSVSRLVESLS